MKCLWCHRPLRRWLLLSDDGQPSYGYNGDGLFDTLRCGYAYAVAAVKSGRVQ